MSAQLQRDSYSLSLTPCNVMYCIIFVIYERHTLNLRLGDQLFSGAAWISDSKGALWQQG